MDRLGQEGFSRTLSLLKFFCRLFCPIIRRSDNIMRTRWMHYKRYRCTTILFERWSSQASIGSAFAFYRLKLLVLSHLQSFFFLAHLSTTCSRGAFRVMMCPSCIVNNFFKHLLLPNRWAYLDQTWQECSLGGPLQKLFTEFDSIKNSGCHGNEIEFFKQLFKNLLVWNRWSDFEIISQKCSLGDPF